MRWWRRLGEIMCDGKAVCKQCLGTARVRLFILFTRVEVIWDNLDSHAVD